MPGSDCLPFIFLIHLQIFEEGVLLVNVEVKSLQEDLFFYVNSVFNECSTFLVFFTVLWGRMTLEQVFCCVSVSDGKIALLVPPNCGPPIFAFPLGFTDMFLRSGHKFFSNK